MLRDLKIPRMGSVENARMVGWRLAEGQSFQAGDVLYEVETDKTTTEIEADEPGILARCTAAEGEDFKVGDRVGFWAPAGTKTAAVAAALKALDGGVVAVPEAQPISAPTFATAAANPDLRPVPRSAANGVRISPLARRLAALHGVDVSSVKGSGAGGRITGADVLAVASGGTAIAQPAASLAPPPPVHKQAAPPPQSEAHVVPHSSRRLAIARKMTEAAAIPSLTADMEIDMTVLLAHRKAEPGASVLGLLAQHAVAVLMTHPRLNAHWRDDALVQWQTVHLGVAVDAPDGLVVPVIRNAERLSARGLTEAIAYFAEQARSGKLQQKDLEGGTFTISNPGSIGPVIRAEALLNPPQVALLGLPGMIRTPKAVQDGDGWAVAVRPVIRPSLTFDHRALDGGPVVAFLNDLRSRIEGL